MEASIEERLTALYGSAKGGSEVPREVYRRLQFLARVLRYAPAATGAEILLLWLDARGGVASASVGRAGIVIGREAACDVVLASPRVSRRHCALRRTTGGNRAVEIEDLGSSNGTLVNGASLSAHGKKDLQDGDVIEVGGVALAVAMAGAQKEW